MAGEESEPSSDRSSSGNGAADALDAFVENNQQFRSRIEEIDSDDPTAPAAYVSAVDSFIGSMAAWDPSETLKRQIIDIVNESVPSMTKKAVETELNKQIRNVGRSSAERKQIDEILRNELDRIEKLSSGDTESESRYRFVFEGGDSFVVDPETLYSPTNFRRAYSGVYDEMPVWFGEMEDWEALIHDLQQTCLIEKVDAVGPRVSAMNQLSARVSTSEAYLDAGDAVRKGNGVFIEAESVEEAERASTIWVASEEIKRICEDNEISMQALRIELDSRDLRPGASEQKWFGNRRASFWPLVREEFAEKLIEDPEAGESSGAGDGSEGKEVSGS